MYATLWTPNQYFTRYFCQSFHWVCFFQVIVILGVFIYGNLGGFPIVILVVGVSAKVAGWYV